MRKTIDPCKISPLHGIEDNDLLAQLIRSMYRDGWDGRPLLATMYKGEVCALTGSHRIHAARHVNRFEVPYYLVSMTEEQAERCFEGFQSDRLMVVRETGDADAIALFEQEFESGR